MRLRPRRLYRGHLNLRLWSAARNPKAEGCTRTREAALFQIRASPHHRGVRLGSPGVGVPRGPWPSPLD